MKNLKRSHWLLIIVSVLILSGCIGITAYLLFSNYHNVRLYKQAQQNFQRGDQSSLALAEVQLQQLIRTDSDNEAAFIMLGEIARRRKIYPEQVYFCYMAHRLNPLSEENKANYIRSLWNARYFDRLENFLAQQSELQGDLKQLLYYAAGRNGNIQKYKFSPKEINGTLGSLAHLIFAAEGLTTQQKLARLNTFEAKSDSVTQEILAAKTEHYLAINDLDNAEKALKEAFWLNPYAFAPPLGRFYANFRNLGLALEVFEKHLTTYHDPAIALQTAEIYCLLKKTAGLTRLRNHYQGDSGRQAMMLCYCFDAMNALISNDMASLKEFLVPLRKNYRSTLALFMFFCADIHEKNLSSIRENYIALTSSRGYVDLKLRADDILSGFLRENLTTLKNKDEEILALAKLLYGRRKELFAAKLILILQKKSNTVSFSLLKDTMKRFPEDQGVMKLAVEYTLRRDKTACKKLIAEFKKKFPKSAKDMFRYELILAAGEKDLDRVSELFRSNFTPSILREYWTFAASTMREKDLQFLMKEKLYAPFCQALLLLKKGEKKVACDILERSDAQSDPDLLFFAARTLAENGRNRSALKKYDLIPQNSPYKLDVLLNKSELLAEMGSHEQALEFARRAYKLAPDRPETQLCYGEKLMHSNQLAELPDVIDLRRSSPYQERLKGLWIAGMNQRIKNSFQQNQRARSRELCEQLRKISPQDKVANEYLLKLDELDRQEQEAKLKKMRR